MRRISLLLAILMLVTMVSPIIANAGEVQTKISINGKLVEFNDEIGYPFVDENNRTLVPLRATLEAIGAEVSWNQYTQTAKAERFGTRVEIPIGQPYILVEGMKVQNDTAAVIKDGKTYVPIRKVMEAYNCKVNWDKETSTVVIQKHMNPYTQEMLKKLVEETPCDENILEFRKANNSRRRGLKKVEGKYFDIYYPNDEQGKEVADFLAPFMDTAYMFLTDLYGQQAPVEVHLIHEKDTKDLKEGNIREAEQVTFIWIEPDNDDGGNNLAELIHEMNHNFFSYVNNDWSWADDEWSSFVDEALAKLIPSIYINYAYDIEEVAMRNFESDFMYTAFDVRRFSGVLTGEDYVTLDEAVHDYLSKPKSWGHEDGRHKAAQLTSLAFWIYVYNEYGIEKIQEVVKTLGEGDYKPKLEKMFGKTTDELSNDLINAMKKVYETY